MPVAGGDDRRRRPRRRSARDFARSARQCLLRLANRRRRRGRCGVRRRGPCRRAAISTITASSPTRWSRAASLGFGTRIAAGTRPMSRARASMRRATTPPARSALPPAAVRFVAPDVGGGFGAKNFIYPEHVLILWAAKRVGRPVKWIATRSEVFLADHQARDHTAEAALALDADGRFLGLARRQRRQCRRLSGQRRRGADLPVRPSAGHGLPHSGDRASRSLACLTNTAPIGVTRGPGFAEAVNIIERLIDKAARQCGFDRAELRRRNMVPAAAMPVTNAFGNTVDSGAFPRPSTVRWRAADIAGFPARRRESEARGLSARARLCLSHQGDRRLAAPRMSTSASRRTAPCR